MTATVPDFLSSVASATDSAARADRHKLADLVAELAAGKRPSIDAPATASLLQRLGLSGENLEELVTVRQRLNALREQAAVGPELREHLRETTATYSKTIEEITKQEQALRARREAAENELRLARGEVEQAQVAGRAAADSMAALLDLLHPALQHNLRSASSGVKVSGSKIAELTRKIREDEEGLRAAGEDEDLRPDLRAARIEALEHALAGLRRELAEVEEQHARAQKEHASLAREAALLAGEQEAGR
ncbi:MAG: hypothetical protein IT458_19745 [Planctomycetes bacterium]|nr:hypothetical protein [Planctomycetota bacterium]